MLGPLPPLYRWVVAVCALTAFVGLGAWAAYYLPVPLLVQGGAVVGAVVGTLVVLLLVHDSPDAGGTRVRTPRS